jgi:hypothetical protein
MIALAAISGAALSAVLAMSPQSSTPDACLKLRMHIPLNAVDVELTRRGVVWDGSKISRAQFDIYVRQERTTEPKSIFIVRWDASGLRDVDAITDEIRAGGFEVAMNCPPIPM